MATQWGHSETDLRWGTKRAQGRSWVGGLWRLLRGRTHSSRFMKDKRTEPVCSVCIFAKKRGIFHHLFFSWVPPYVLVLSPFKIRDQSWKIPTRSWFSRNISWMNENILWAITWTCMEFGGAVTNSLFLSLSPPSLVLKRILKVEICCTWQLPSRAPYTCSVYYSVLTQQPCKAVSHIYFRDDETEA